MPVNPPADELGGDHQRIHMFASVAVFILQRLFFFWVEEEEEEERKSQIDPKESSHAFPRMV